MEGNRKRLTKEDPQSLKLGSSLAAAWEARAR